MILFDWHFQQHLPNKTHHLPWIHVTPVFLNIFTTTIKWNPVFPAQNHVFSYMTPCRNKKGKARVAAIVSSDSSPSPAKKASAISAWPAEFRTGVTL